jgi:hypothetical protein
VAWLPWHRQVQAIIAIERLGGHVQTEPVGPDSLRSIVGNEVMAGYDHVYGVSLLDTLVTDTGLVHLKGLTNLNALTLWSTHVTDTELTNSRHCRRDMKCLLNAPESDSSLTVTTGDSAMTARSVTTAGIGSDETEPANHHPKLQRGTPLMSLADASGCDRSEHAASTSALAEFCHRTPQR